MGIIKDRFKEKGDAVAAEIKELLKEHGTKKIGEVQLSQIYQGMRGMSENVFINNKNRSFTITAEIDSGGADSGRK